MESDTRVESFVCVLCLEFVRPVTSSLTLIANARSIRQIYYQLTVLYCTTAKLDGKSICDQFHF